MSSSSTEGLSILGITLFLLYIGQGFLKVHEVERTMLEIAFAKYKAAKRKPTIPPYDMTRMTSIGFQAIMHSYTKLGLVTLLFIAVHILLFSSSPILLRFYLSLLFMLRYIGVFCFIMLITGVQIYIMAKTIALDQKALFNHSTMKNAQQSAFFSAVFGTFMTFIALSSKEDS